MAPEAVEADAPDAGGAAEEARREAAAVEAFQVGEARLRSGDATSASSCFMRAATALPGWPDAWLRLGVCFHHLRRYDEACAAMRHGLELSEWDDPPAVLTYVDALREGGHLSKVIDASARVPAGHPLSHFAHLLAGWAATARDGPGAAEAFFARALAAEPGNPLYAYLQSYAASGPLGAFPAGCRGLREPAAMDDDQLFVRLQRAQHHLDSPGLLVLNDKVSLHRLLSAHGACFWPAGFVLPAERGPALEAEAAVPASGAGYASSGHQAPCWVHKRRAGMGGLGVAVCTSAADVAAGDAEEESLLQEYVWPPVLLSAAGPSGPRHRFSLRVFLVLYLGGGGLAGYMAREGLALMAPRPWPPEEGDALSHEAHITNQSAAMLTTPDGSLTRDISGLKDEDLAGWPGGVEALWSQVESLAGGLLEASRGLLQKQVGEFRPLSGVLVPKLLGLDILLSAEGGEAQPARAWLVEVNRHPSLGEHYACARRVKRRVTLDAWLLLWGRGEGQEAGIPQEACAAAAPAWPEAYGCLRRVG